MRFNSILLILSLAVASATALQSRDFDSLTTGGQPLSEDDGVFSPDHRSNLKISLLGRGSTLRLFSLVGGRYTIDPKCPRGAQILSFALNNKGNLVVECQGDKKTTIVLANGPVDKYTLLVDDNTSLRVVNSKNKQVYKFDTGCDIDQDFNNWKQTYMAEGKLYGGGERYDVTAYVIDSASLARDDVEKESQLSHSNYVGGIINNRNVAANVEVDTMSGNGKTFNERQFVEAVQRFYQKATTDPRYQIINFSGAFRQENSDVADCAIQWVFKKGLYFVAAAGNDGKLRNKYNPYQILVGGVEFDDSKYNGRPWEFNGQSTRYGNAVTVWAPAELACRPVQGTSVAAARTTRHLVAMLNSNVTLRSNSDWGYAHLYSSSVTGTLNNSWTQFKKSPNAENKIIRALESTGYSRFDKKQDFCASLKLPATNPTSRDWGKLYSLAGANVIGDFVATYSSSICSCSGFFCRC